MKTELEMRQLRMARLMANTLENRARTMTPSFWHKLLNSIRKMSKRESESRKSKKRLIKLSDFMRPKNKRKDVRKSSKRNLRLRQLSSKQLN